MLPERSCARFHQLFHSGSLQNIRVACSSQLDDQEAFIGKSIKCFLRCYLWIQNLHAVCIEEDVRKEQTFSRRLWAASHNLRRRDLNTNCRTWQCLATQCLATQRLATQRLATQRLATQRLATQRLATQCLATQCLATQHQQSAFS
jgi:hypothetical protein